MYKDDPSIIWSDLKDQFKQSNETHIYQLTNDAALTHQGSESVSNIYTKLKTLWREINAYGETPHCDCGKCVSNINGRINDHEDRLKIRKFLMGLNDEFRQVRSHILSMDTLPKLPRCIS